MKRRERIGGCGEGVSRWELDLGRRMRLRCRIPEPRLSRDRALASNPDDAEVRDLQAKLSAFFLALLHLVVSSCAVVDWSAFRDAPSMVFTLALLIVFIGNAVLIFYISFYPADRGFTDTALAFYIAAIFNAGSVLGRILPNALSDRIGVFNTITPFTLLLGLTMLCLLGVRLPDSACCWEGRVLVLCSGASIR
ncbi:hypothetical protein MMC18_007957 [Xylographa bjoerkii]|nr:hypothetical protein [Xylographa bjoerkii]